MARGALTLRSRAGAGRRAGLWLMAAGLGGVAAGAATKATGDGAIVGLLALAAMLVGAAQQTLP